MKIALLTLGTRGDVQPYAVLGQALKQRGHQVTLSTAKNFETFVKSYELDFIPVDADFQSFLNSDEGKKMMKNPFRAQKNLSKWVHPMVYNALTTFYEISKDSDKVLFHVKTIADHFADQFPEKMIRANVIPAFQPTREFVNPVFSGLSLPDLLNKFTYKLSELGISLMNKPIKKFRETAGLSKNYPKKIELPSLYGISSNLLKKPADYPENSCFTGFWYGSSPTELESNLTEFIKNGEPPILLTFGSMPFDTRFDLQKSILKLSEELNIRIIIVKGWGFDNTSELEKSNLIKIVQTAPYEKLLPLVKAVIHHGGIGTMAECMRAGKPFFTCPVLFPLGDQHFWGQLAYRKGLAVKPIPLKKLTEKIFINKTEELLNSGQLYDNSKQFSDKLKNEDGIMNAINAIEKNFC